MVLSSLAVFEFLWSTNNSYWLQHLLGTSFYNSYLRLCGDKIGYDIDIYTTFIGEEVGLSTISYQDQTYELHPIQIGSYCSINTLCVLYDGVVIEDHVYVEPMSTIRGHVKLSIEETIAKDRSYY